MKQLILGMVAHVDAGKTTLTESLLFSGGAISATGRVDHGTAFLDTAELEKNRGITIYSKEGRMEIGDTEVTLLDTPGHVDFSPEMERCLSVLDYAILVISGSDGVQSHTETLWRLLRRHKIPTFFFVNKMDLPDLSPEEILSTLQGKLHPACVNFSRKEEGDFFEEIALCDESLLSGFGGSFSVAEISQAIGENLLFPVYFGSALKQEGISAFLDGVMKYSQKTLSNNKAFGAKVFKISRDSSGTRLTHIKVTSGAPAVRDVVKINGIPEKINEIRLYSGKKYQSVPSVATGTICAVTGLSHSVGGGTLGIEKGESVRELLPVLQYRLDLPDGVDKSQALPLLKELEEEDPSLGIDLVGDGIGLDVMGTVQLEVLSAVILERFGFSVTFSQGTILYRETLAEGEFIEGVGHFEPLRHYAEVVLQLSPLPPDSGLVIASDCPSTSLSMNYQHLVLSILESEALTGILTGSLLTDLKITLVGGRAHEKHSQGGDFREATLRALVQGLRQGRNILLEPWSQVFLTLPNQNVGRGIADLQRMGGQCQISSAEDEFSRIEGEVPLSQLGDYSRTVQGYSGGRGQFSQRFLGYRPCVDSASVIAQKGYVADGGASIFCEGGAGFTVPWDQVSAYRHCPSTMEKEVFPPEVLRVHREKYANSLAEDKALLEIFQRTYGKISVEKIQSRKKSVEIISPPQRVKPNFLLVDGYNIIFAWDDLAKIARGNLDSARQRLLDLLCNYQGFYQCPVVVVFDAYKVKGGARSEEAYHNITVVYTKEAETADMYIERCTGSLAADYTVRVATSDGLEQMIILGQGGFRVSARGFQEEVARMDREIEKFLN
ncbi:MAG: translation factor GTPase family protein [Eubacteriales bacterium]